MKGFKDFLMRGNVVDLAVAVVVGTAFTTLVSKFSEAFILPLVKVLAGGEENSDSYTMLGVKFPYGVFVSGLFNFLITAAVVYFVFVLPLKKLNERTEARKTAEPAAPAAPTEAELLTEIRDLLRQQSR